MTEQDKQAAELHTQTAGFLESAAKHHHEAAKHFLAGDSTNASHHAHVARGYTLHAEKPANKAAKQAADALTPVATA